MQNFKSKITKFISIMSLVTLVSLITVGCSNKQNSAKQSDKISIVTTTNVYSDIAKNIVGNMEQRLQLLIKVALIHTILIRQQQMLKR